LGPNNVPICLDVQRTDSIFNVKQKIQEKNGIPIEKQVLVFSGQPLENSKSLGDYNIQKESSIILIIKSN